MSVSTASEKQFSHRKVRSQDPLLTIKPMESRVTGSHFQNNFLKYLNGFQTVNGLISALNYPRTHHVQFESYKSIGDFNVRQTNEAREKFLKSKISSISGLIQQKVLIKKPENIRKRKEESQNFALVQNILDLANRNKTQTQHQRRIPKTKILKGYKLNFDNVQPICNLQREEIQKDSKRPYMKTVLEHNTQLYLEELQANSDNHEAQLNRLVRLNIQQRKYDFQLFHKAANSDRHHKDGIMTIQDVKLYDYLYNKPKMVIIEKHPKYIQNVIDSDIDIKKQITANKHNKRLSRQTQHYNTEKPDNSEESCTSSLQSACEIKLDAYYAETKQLHSKTHTQLSKKIKQLIHLEELNQKAISTSIYKLES